MSVLGRLRASKGFFIAIALLFALCQHSAWARVHSDPSSAPQTEHPAATHPAKKHQPTTPSNAHASHSAGARISHTTHASAATHRRRRRHVLTARERARSRRYQHAFVASSQLRPMAQQLAQDPDAGRVCRGEFLGAQPFRRSCCRCVSRCRPRVPVAAQIP